MTLSTTRGHIVTAVLNGLAAQTAELTRRGQRRARHAVDTHCESTAGLRRSARLMQAVADLTGLPVEVYPSAHATAIGAAACARLACDPALGIEDAIPSGAAAIDLRTAMVTRPRGRLPSDRWRAAAGISCPGEHL